MGPRKPVYAGFNDTHLTEKLRERHHLTVSRESVRGLRLTLRLPAVYRRLPPKHRARRVARPLIDSDRAEGVVCRRAGATLAR